MKYYRPAISPGYILPNINPKTVFTGGWGSEAGVSVVLGGNIISDILHVFLIVIVFS